MMNFKLRIYGRPVSAPQRLMSSTLRPRRVSGGAASGSVQLFEATPPRQRRRLATTRGRRALLVRLADALKARKDEFARLLAVEQLRRFPRLTERNTQMVVRVIRDARRREVLLRTLPP